MRKISQLQAGEAPIAAHAQNIPASGWRSTYRCPCAKYPSFALAKHLSPPMLKISWLRPGEAPSRGRARAERVLGPAPAVRSREAEASLQSIQLGIRYVCLWLWQEMIKKIVSQKEFSVMSFLPSGFFIQTRAHEKKEAQQFNVH